MIYADARQRNVMLLALFSERRERFVRLWSETGRNCVLQASHLSICQLYCYPKARLSVI